SLGTTESLRRPSGAGARHGGATGGDQVSQFGRPRHGYRRTAHRVRLADIPPDPPTAPDPGCHGFPRHSPASHASSRTIPWARVGGASDFGSTVHAYVSTS